MAIGNLVSEYWIVRNLIPINLQLIIRYLYFSTLEIGRGFKVAYIFQVLLSQNGKQESCHSIIRV